MPVKRRKKQSLICAFCILAILSLDQYLKSLVSFNLTTGESIPLIPNILHITLVRNTGAAFGLFKNASVVFAIISIVAVIFISALLARSIKRHELAKNTAFSIGLILIVSGAMGNLVDRLRFGYVIDFIDVRIWPVFNIADTSITIGTALLLISFIFHSPRPHTKST